MKLMIHRKYYPISKSHQIRALIKVSHTQKKEGKIAYVGIKLFQERYDTFLILDLKMRNIGNRWQNIGIRNLSKFIEALDELEK